MAENETRTWTILDGEVRISAAGSRPPTVDWCCTCDVNLWDIDCAGPINHLADHPDHYIVCVTGEMHVYRATVAPSRAVLVPEDPAGIEANQGDAK